MRLGEAEPVTLDYGSAADPAGKLLGNLSGAAEADGLLWTVSDEGRSIECLTPHGAGYALLRSIPLGSLFPDLPSGEADLESMAVCGPELWVCGSHTRVRRATEAQDVLDARFRKRPSRHMLARLRLDDGHLARDPAPRSLPYTGPGSLRRHLSGNPFLGPFVHLPSKEGGLDVEGIVPWGRRVLLGLRGPVLDGIAAVVSVRLLDGFEIDPEGTRLHLLNLGGRGVRDLAVSGADVLVLAGPMGAAPGPYSVYRWRPERGTRVVQPDDVHHWPLAMVGKPEGLCLLIRDSRPGLLVLHDSPDGARLNGSCYKADWHPFT